MKPQRSDSGTIALSSIDCDHDGRHRLAAVRKYQSPDKSFLKKRGEISFEKSIICDGCFSCDFEDTHFESFFHRGNSNYLYVMLRGHRKDSLKKLPEFARWSWFNVVDDNFLCLDNPMYYKYPDILMGWFLGDKELDMVSTTAKFIENVAEILKIDRSHIIIYGSSAAGTAALHISQKIPRSSSVSLNMQLLPTVSADKSIDFMNTGCTLEELGNRADTIKILELSCSNHIIISNIASEEDLIAPMTIGEKYGLGIHHGLTICDNLAIWIYDATGVPNGVKAHTALEDRTMFRAIDYLVKCRIEGKAVDPNVFLIFGEMWHDRYQLISSNVIKDIESLYNSECGAQDAFKICSVTRDNVDANILLGIMYLDGKCTEINYSKALDCFKFALVADFGRLGEIYNILSSHGVVMPSTSGTSLSQMWKEFSSLYANIDSKFSKICEGMAIYSMSNENYSEIRLIDILKLSNINNNCDNSKSNSLTSGEYYRLSLNCIGEQDSDYDKAICLMRQSLKLGYWRAKGELLNLLIDSGDPKYYPEIRSIYEENAELASGNLFRIGKLFIEGIIFSKNVDAGLNLIRRSALNGYRPAKEFLKTFHCKDLQVQNDA